MSMMSVPFIADTAARVMGGLTALAPKTGRRFPEIPGKSERLAVPTRHGDVACTLYRPPGGATAAPPVYLNAHGGGFVIRYPEQDDPLCRFIAHRAGIVVLNVDYDVAPRVRFPVPVEELYDVAAWASSEERDWDGARLCIGGQSAGGALSAAVARLALENGGPRIALQVLHYAVLDLVTPPSAKRSRAARPVLRPWMGEMFHTAYIPDPQQCRDRLASPVWGPNADGLEGIAAALVITAELDGLRNEAAAYARKLDAVGSLAAYREVPGADHGYDIVGDDEERIRESYGVIVEHVLGATAAA